MFFSFRSFENKSFPNIKSITETRMFLKPVMIIKVNLLRSKEKHSIEIGFDVPVGGFIA